MEKGNKPEENHVSKTSSSAINQDTQVKNEIRQDFQGLGMHNRYHNNSYLVSKWSSRGLHWTFLQLFSILPLRCDHWNKIDTNRITIKKIKILLVAFHFPLNIFVFFFSLFFSGQNFLHYLTQYLPSVSWKRETSKVTDILENYHDNNRRIKLLDGTVWCAEHSKVNFQTYSL